jgi:predicted amidohydrolase
MKAYIIQPFYSFEQKDLEKCFYGMLDLLDTVGEDADIIVLPEYCDIPAACDGKAAFHGAIEKYNATIKQKAAEAARRCHALVFFNAADGGKNTTYALDREGNVVYKYYKAHPAPSEVKTEKQGGNEMDVAYSYEFRTPDVVVKVDPEKLDMVETRVIDGMKYILIRADNDVEVNGVNIKIKK